MHEIYHKNRFLEIFKAFSKATLLLEGSDSKILAEGFFCLKEKCSIEILMNCHEIRAKITVQYFEVAWNCFFYVIAENFIGQSYFSIHFSVVCQEIIYKCHGYWFLECRYMHLNFALQGGSSAGAQNGQFTDQKSTLKEL